ncbi:MAG: phage terminase large subunit [Solirubrobacterales bacterium]
MRSPAELQTLARAGPAALGILTDSRFALPPHLALIDEQVVEAVWRAGKRPRPEILLISAPPRHGKSTIVSEYLPAWFLGTFPERRVILTSYEADFAASWGAKTRGLLEAHGRSLYGIRVDERSRSASRWDLAGKQGGMITAGVGGPITGRGAHLLVIDDPIKNAEQSQSPTIRAKQWDWWLSTARTRLEPGGVVVVVMTRWHQGDLGGKLLQASAEGGDPVTEVRLPALAEPNDPLGREVGKPLWPERYDRDYLEASRETLGAHWYAAIYQGRPSPEEGGMFNHADFRYFTIEGDEVVLRQPDDSNKRFPVQSCQRFQVVDLAASEKETADYTVIAEYWRTPEADLLVRSVVRERVAVPDQPAFFKEHHTGCPVKVEAIGYQAGMVQTMSREGFPVEPVYPDADKVSRAGVAGVLYRGGKVYHLAGAPWQHDFEAELLAFPAGEHDDQVDTIGYAAKALPSIYVGGYRQKRKGKTITGGLMNKQF